MELKDLTKNRTRIIGRIKGQGINNVAKVMNYMAAWIELDGYKRDKATKKNIDALTNTAIKKYMSVDFKETATNDQMQEWNRMACNSSLRKY